jgi:hypothetical protein
MARPKNDALAQRRHVAKCTLTDEEQLSVKMNAAAGGISIAEYIRRRAVGLIVTPPASRADAALLSEINRIGVNVNQLAFAFNADREFKGDWQAVRDELIRVLEKVALAYGA